jgi:glycosyltransferase involved in cell wall biosynthesis
MRILFLTLRADFGGGPEHLYQLLKHRAPDIDAYVACPNDPPYADRYRDLLGPDRIIWLPHRAFRLSALYTLWKAARRHDLDLIHSHGKGAGIYARLLGPLLRVPVLHTFHGLHVGSYGPLMRALYIWIERLLSLATRTFICVSDGEASQIAAARLAPVHKLQVIPNGVAIPEAVTRPDWTGGRLHIVAVNRFDHQKNPDLLVDIATQLRPLVDFRMDVIGTGPRFEDIRARIAATGLSDHVILHGAVTDPRRTYRSAHIFLSTSRWEGLPLALLEGMSEGLCVLATDVVGNADAITHGSDGLLYRDAAGACDALRLLDPPSWHRLGHAARAAAGSKHSVERMAQRTHQAWIDTAGGRHPAPDTG